MSQSGVINATGGGGGSITLTPESGGAIVGTSFPIDGKKAYTVSPVDVVDTSSNAGTFLIANNAWTTAYIVDPSSTEGLKGTYTTIQAAIDAAVLNGASLTQPTNIFIRPGLYVEAITVPDGVWMVFVGYPATLMDQNTSNGTGQVTIDGIFTIDTYSVGTVVDCENIWFLNSATGDCVVVPNFQSFGATNCYFQNFFGTYTINSLSSNVYLQNCIFPPISSGIKIDNNGDGYVTFNNCTIDGPIELDNFFTLTLLNCDLGSSTSITSNDTVKLVISNCQYIGTCPFIVGTSTGDITIKSLLAGVGGSNVQIITTPGNVYYTNLSIKPINNTFAYVNIAPTSAQEIPMASTCGNLLKSVQTATDYSASYYDYYVGVTDTSVARAVHLPENPVPNSVFIVKDESGLAGTNNITVDVTGGANIDGVTTATISTNYGSLVFKADGTATNYFITAKF